MRINPYLNFDGTCEEAFRFYQRVLGGTIEAMMNHEETPMAAELPPDWGKRIMHARLAVDGQVLMGSDSPPDHFEPARGMYVSINLPDAARGKRIFAALAEGGKIIMPFEPTFWADGFGMLTDRFGTPWMVNCQREE